MMSTNPVQTLYTYKARLYQFFFIDFLQWEKVLATFFQENFTLHSGMKILDAGCGSGTVTKVLYDFARRNGYENICFHGFDLTPSMLDLFHQWMDEEGIRDIQLQQANVLDLENHLPEGWVGYDLIVSSAMLEYIPKEKLSQALSNLKRLLHKKGRLLVIVTKRTWVTRWIAAKWWGTNLFDRAELEVELRQAGLATIQRQKLPGLWDSFMMAIEAKDD